MFFFAHNTAIFISFEIFNTIRGDIPVSVIMEEGPTPVCFVCEQMATRKQKKQPVVYDPSSRTTDTCVLCARPFCDKHKLQGSNEVVCQVNHLTYYGKHRQIPGIFPDLQARERHLEENPPYSPREL